MHRVTGHSTHLIALFALTTTLAAHSGYATVVTNNFDSNPFWTGMGNTTGGAFYGFTNSALAGGTPGELGGVFTRRAAENYYASIFMSGVGPDALNYDSDIEGSGKVIVSSVFNFNNSVYIGHRSSAIPDFSFVGLNISEFSGTHVRFFASIIADDSSPYFSAAMLVPIGSVHDFSYVYDPDGGVNSLGRLTVSVTGAVTNSAFVDVTAAQRAGDPIFLNAFGIGSPNTFLADTNNLVTVFFDNAIYTIPEPSAMGLVALAGLLCLRSRRS